MLQIHIIDHVDEEFSAFFEYLTLVPGHLLLLGNYNLHVDQSNDSDARRFMQVLNSFDLKQHVVAATHRDGHTLDLVITRNCEKDIISDCRVRHRISDHFAIQCKLDFAKPPLERKEVFFRKIQSIDFDNFRHELECSSLVSHPSEVLDVLVERYNKTLEALLDYHAHLKRKTVTIRPHTPWYTEEIATEKRKEDLLSGAGGHHASQVITRTT